MSVFKLAFPKINYSGVGAIEALIERLSDEHGSEKGLLICARVTIHLVGTVYGIGVWLRRQITR